ncbi:hypothetical protein GGF46_002879 [Coemansia sp. RSA 552]|nr:hypothetical protein GGF46_002879 [Coemansia sp. RSA 552]
MFSQMATTAAGVAVGSAVGHTLANGVSSMFGGGSSEAAPPQQQQQPAEYAPMQQHQQASAYENQFNRSCETDARAFTSCLENTGNDMSACQFYLDSLKQCQATMKGFGV